MDYKHSKLSQTSGPRKLSESDIKVREERKQRRAQREQANESYDGLDRLIDYYERHDYLGKNGRYNVWRLNTNVDIEAQDSERVHFLNKAIKNYLESKEQRKPEMKAGREYYVQMKARLSHNDGRNKMFTFPRKDNLYIVNGSDDIRKILKALASTYFFRAPADINAVYQSGERWAITAIVSFDAIPTDTFTDFEKKTMFKRTVLHKMSMKGTSLYYKLLQNVKPTARAELGMCVIDYLWNVICDSNAGSHPFMKTYTRDKLINDFGKLVLRDTLQLRTPEIYKSDKSLDDQADMTPAQRNDEMIKQYGITLAQILEWATTHHANVFAFDSCSYKISTLLKLAHAR
jgi:hypothetical protein